jgi:hypothetical protein
MPVGKDHVTSTNERLGAGPIEVQIWTMRGKRVEFVRYVQVLVAILAFSMVPLITAYVVLPDPAGPIVGTALFVAFLLGLVLLADPQRTVVRYTGDIRHVEWNGSSASLVHPNHHIPVSLVYTALLEASDERHAEAGRVDAEPAKPVDEEDRERAARRLRSPQ